MADSHTGGRPGREPASAAGFVVTFVMFGAMLLIATAIQLPPGAIPGWAARQAPAFAAIWPSSWKFFEDGDSVGVLDAYQGDIASGRVTRVMPAIVSPVDRWGLGRASSAASVQLMAIDLAVPADAWRLCGADLPTCLAQAGRPDLHPVDNPAVAPTVCGPTVLTIESAEPATGSPSRLVTWRVSRFVELDVRCA